MLCEADVPEYNVLLPPCSCSTEGDEKVIHIMFTSSKGSTTLNHFVPLFWKGGEHVDSKHLAIFRVYLRTEFI